MDILSKTNKSTPPLLFGDIVCVALAGLKSTMQFKLVSNAEIS